MTILHLQSLHIYPVKSARGVDLQATDVHKRGLKGDRRFMLVDSTGKFITQRETPKLAQLSVQLTETHIVLSWPNHVPLTLNIKDMQTRQSVIVWRSTVEACVAGEGVTAALSDWLGTQVSLVFMNGESQRMANPDWTATPSPVSFADGYPILVTNTASLNALNALIVEGGNAAVPMTRFRPNIVIDSDTAWGEDDWRALKIGDVILDLVKPCTRCIMTTLDQDTGTKQGREPLRALKTLRTSTDPRNPGVLFGMNAVVRTLGQIEVGDKVELI